MLGQVVRLDLDGDAAVVSEAGDGEGGEGNGAGWIARPVLVRRPVGLVQLQRFCQRLIEAGAVLSEEAVENIDRWIQDVLQQVPRSHGRRFRMRVLDCRRQLLDEPRPLQPVGLQCGHPVINVLVVLAFAGPQSFQRNLAQLGQPPAVPADHCQPESGEPVARVGEWARSDRGQRVHLMTDAALHRALLRTGHREQRGPDLERGHHRFPGLQLRGPRVGRAPGLEVQQGLGERGIDHGRGLVQPADGHGQALAQGLRVLLGVRAGFAMPGNDGCHGILLSVMSNFRIW